MQGAAIVRHVVTFGRVLREVGIEVGPGRVSTMLSRPRRRRPHAAGRRLLHASADARLAPRRARALRPRVRRLVPARSGRAARPPEADAPLRGPGRARHARVRAGRRRGGRSVDAARARRLRARAPAGEGLRRDDARGVRARAAPHGRDRADAAATARRVGARPTRAATGSTSAASAGASLRSGGEPIEQPWKARKTVAAEARRPLRHLGLDGCLRAGAPLLPARDRRHGRGVEAFAFGTRLTRLTPDLATRDPGGGARAGERDRGRLGQRNAHRRARSPSSTRSTGGARSPAARSSSSSPTAGSATIPDLVGREMAKLARAAYAVVWVNPLKGNPEYQPLAGGMRAALPFVDRFLPGHNLRSLEELGAVLAGIERRHAA